MSRPLFASKWYGSEIAVPELRKEVQNLYEQLDSIDLAWGALTGVPATFPPDAHTHVKADITDFGSYLPLTGGSVTGNVTLAGGTTRIGDGGYDLFLTGGVVFRDYANAALTNGRLYFQDDAWYFRGGGEGEADAATDTSMFIRHAGAFSKVWHAGNDGAASGLDADLLDGVQGASYLRSDASDTFTGTLTIAGSIAGATSITAGYFDGTSGNPFRGFATDGVTAPSFTWTGDLNTGMYTPGADQIGFTTGGASRLTISSAGLNMVTGQLLAVAADTVTVPSFSWSGDTNTGMYRSNTDQIGFATAGVQRVNVNSSGVQVTGSINATVNISNVVDIFLDDQILSVGDTDTYMQFHAADQWRVVTGGVERLEVNNTQVTVAGTLSVVGNLIIPAL